ncbi:hypothetical protein [Ancylobacter vacuolatus]|uniref:Hpr(Ser) kinase/phosphatase n=1 Tax=Ancylobacter vacuolatus TaxID=223389 RepID=A0ABU0DHZ9_9HYPH|nr:hypothetical protein [Ancylobacter vacuolatus]MDQ0348059.1 hypothetical protein [Ancylobacter vacuolatus]
MPDSHVMRLSAFGAVMEIACRDPDARAACTAALPAYWQRADGAEPDMRFAIESSGPAHGGAARFRFLEESTLRGNDLTRAQVAPFLAWRMDYQLGAFARDCAFIHAGVVLHEGRALLFPGTSHAGKSTLTAALVRAGATYISDDVAVIGLDGRLSLLSRALTLRADMAGDFHLPEAGGAARLREGSPPVGAVLVLTYRAGAPPLDLKPLSAGEAMLRLVANAMNARHQPETVLGCCAAALALAWSGEGVRGAADAAAGQILSQMTHVRPALVPPCARPACSRPSSTDRR